MLPTVRYVPRSFWSTSTMVPFLRNGGIVGDLLHAEHGRAGNLVLTQDVDRLVVGLVGQPLLDLGEDVEGVRLVGLGGGVGRVVDPLGLIDGKACLLPVLFLDREVDVGVGGGLPLPCT